MIDNKRQIFSDGGRLVPAIRSTVLSVVCILFALGAVQAQVPVTFGEGGKATLAPILREVTPAIVNIAVTSQAPAPNNPLFNDPFFRRFFDVPEHMQPVPQQAAGSGVIIDADKGYVLTNNHVIEQAQEIRVTLADRRSFTARLVGTDPGTDIALLQIDAKDLKAVPIGNSDAVEVGDFVIAIGNPFGLGQTVTSGIVSALGRSGLNVEGYEDFIQTDASINPGNSGGGLITLDGELIGINSAIISPGGGNVGIGFAVPSNMAKAVMQQLLQFGEVHRGRLGIGIQEVTPALANALKLSVNEGAVVTSVESGSPAERAGIKAGDVIVALNGKPITGASSLRNRVGLMPAGEKVQIGLVRDGKQKTITAQIEAAPQATAQQPESAPDSAQGGIALQQLRGVEFTNLDRTHPAYGKVSGVLVSRVDSDSVAWRAGLRQGDIVIAVNWETTRSVAELEKALGSAGSSFALQVVRDSATLYIVIQ